MLLALLLALGFAASPASADTPVAALAGAMQRTALAKTAHVTLAQRYTAAGRTLATSVSGALAHGDQDLVTQGESGESRRIAVGPSVYQRRPNDASAPWTRSARSAPATDQAFGSLTLPDGTSLSDPKLYRNVQDAGSEQLPGGLARKLTADVDMTAVATALRLGAADQARLAQMQASITVWIATTDGTLLRHALVLTIPGPAGPRTITTTIDLSDLDAPLTVRAP